MGQAEGKQKENTCFILIFVTVGVLKWMKGHFISHLEKCFVLTLGKEKSAPKYKLIRIQQTNAFTQIFLEKKKKDS